MSIGDGFVVLSYTNLTYDLLESDHIFQNMLTDWNQSAVLPTQMEQHFYRILKKCCTQQH